MKEYILILPTKAYRIAIGAQAKTDKVKRNFNSRKLWISPLINNPQFMLAKKIAMLFCCLTWQNRAAALKRRLLYIFIQTWANVDKNMQHTGV